MDTRPARVAQLLLVVALFAVAAVASAMADPQAARVEQPGAETGEAPAAEPPDAEPPRREADSDADNAFPAAEPSLLAGVGDSSLARFLVALLLIALAGVATALLWRNMRDRVTLRRLPEPERAPAAERAERVRSAVRASLDALAADGSDPRAAVIGCWLRLEQAAEAAGTRREAADTPTDLAARMLAAHHVSQAPLGRLAAAYRQARYAPHEIGEELRDEAADALRLIHAELSAVREQAAP